MEDFGTALKRALDSHGIGASELAKTAWVTLNAVAEMYSFSAHKKSPRKISYLRGDFLFATVWLPSCTQRKVYGRRRILC